MQSFYQNWLKKNNEENKRALSIINPQNQNQQDPIPSTSSGIMDPIASTSAAAIQSTSTAIPSTSTVTAPTSASDIVYEKDGLQLLVERGLFQRQKKFSLQAKITLS